MRNGIDWVLQMITSSDIHEYLDMYCASDCGDECRSSTLSASAKISADSAWRSPNEVGGCGAHRAGVESA